MKHMALTITLTLLALLAIAPLAGKAMFDKRFNDQVKELFSRSPRLDDKYFSYDQLKGLPKPVKEYFMHVLPEKQPYISYVRLKHDGWFRTDPGKKRMEIKGEQYFTAAKPGFIWRGKTSLFTARDMYIADQGRLVVSLFSLFKVADEQGPSVDQAELLRWLGESVWFPTNLLPRENLHWTAIDNSRARLTLDYSGISVYYVITFNENQEIVRFETERYMGDKGLKPWIGEVSEYTEIQGVRVPSVIEASWDLDGGMYTYGRFRVKQMEYDVPEKY